MSTTVDFATIHRSDSRADDARVAGCHTLADVFELRAAGQSDTIAYRFVHDGARADEILTFGALDRRARAIASRLQQVARPGDRALLLFTPGLDYIAAIVACLYAGIIAVPAYPPHPRRADARIDGIAGDCAPAIVLTAGALRERLAAWRRRSTLDAVTWLAIDELDGAQGVALLPWRAREGTALLQYTSGSTREPRGVRLSHANLLDNLARMQRHFVLSEGTDCVFWLPPFHDMGLIGGILQPAYAAARAVLLSPASFLQRPLTWLETIARFRATTSAAPNFAYDLCVERSTPEERAALDLSAWRIALNGAEPVRAETIERFSRVFACAGFRREAFVSCYGLAEATLMVAGTATGTPPAVARVSRAALARDRLRDPENDEDATQLVSCGAPLAAHDVRIVDPATGEARTDDEVGEIWITGPSIAEGYWSPVAGSGFGAFLIGDDRRWLRTGDLGALRGGELYVAGRAKDLLIIAGRNFYPQDVEWVAERSDARLHAGRAAAFARPTSRGGEELIVVIEVARRTDAGGARDLCGIVRRAVAEQVGVMPAEIVLVRAGAIPRTSSGKLRRAATREALQEGGLDVIARDDGDTGESIHTLAPEHSREWLRRWLAREVGAAALEEGDRGTLRDLGVESLDVVRLVVDAERELGVRVDPAHLWRAAGLTEIAALLRGRADPTAGSPTEATTEIDGLMQVESRLRTLREAGQADPYFAEHDGISGSVTTIAGRELTSFGSYNYLGLAGHPAVIEAAVQATRRWGTSVSASRLVTGEREVHHALERALADFLGADDALTFVSGHATNVTTIPCLVGDGDLVIADALAHDSIVQGARLSGARRLVFPHNDWAALDAMLRDLRHRYRRALVVIEGVYSADGDIPDLARFVEVKRRRRALLMVDEAHSFGVLGATGRGLLEHAAVAAGEVDVLMGTLSKALASCGGYIAGDARLVRYLKYAAPGFVFSVGLPPANAAAALAALTVLRDEPDRVATLRRNATDFLGRVRAAGADVGGSQGTPVIPVIVGDSLRAIRVADRLRELGVSAPPMVAPAVAERLARLRFFVTSEHSAAQLEGAAVALERALRDCPG